MLSPSELATQISGAFSAAREWFLRLWRDREPDADADAEPIAFEHVEGVEDPAPPSVVRQGPEANERSSTRWHLRGGILDRLDEYFFCLRQVRVYDRDSYELFKRVGLTVPAETFANPKHEDHATMPPSISFGGVLISQGHEYDADRIQPSFVYFRKLTRVPRVQAFQGAIYELTVVYDQRQYVGRWISEFVGPLRCHVGVGADGAMTLLREAVPVRHTITTGRKRGHRRDQIVITGAEWIYPAWTAEVAAEHHEPAEQWISCMLRMAFHTHRSASEKIVIRVARDACCAAFGIDVARAKYFFADREVEALAADGRKKRIFHAVREHQRRITEARETTVRYHYRGIRSFAWNRYAVHISLPGDSTAVLRFDAPGQVRCENEDTRGYYDSAQAGDVFAGVLDR
jgi:hypothetical protein